ncbi:3-oxoacyl-[acyl-carrier-protein] synthase III C-terminal domain-containing protein [Streptomyces europaeiscabiei]|uniref:3-oxoacyl-[acyl-carrier-protein] synthase III C-terminal domain-containing protein n=1 Tax=Streptomyces europaeiscabiei TaxID=146819 RepID=UPI0029A0403C|nr:3-oxoacyl-[acyl-carrier-protein] synthase III C-terminal domain-containing protein [Streptomyces europaeiscabiei]MDX2525289.1 3-oxoacyl-[acyl-carrier-protein] synthase III C-terminal domain-containing protein [Streptomyces europaeiscabiei]
MTSIEAVSVHVPAERAPVAARLRPYETDENRLRLYERFYGFSEISVDTSGTLTGLLVAALEGLPELASLRHRVRYVLHARSMPVAAPYPLNPLREACESVGLDGAATFSVTQHACASPLLAVDLAGRLLADDGIPDARAVVLTGDKTFTAAARIIPDSAVMGEASTAVLVRAGGSHDRMLSYATSTHGRYKDGPWMSPDIGAAFQSAYAGALADVISAAVRTAGLAMNDIALILPHNVNQLSWLRVLRMIGVAADHLFLDNLPRLGHCFGSDPFVNLRSARQLGRLRRGDRYIMTAVGLGATFSAMVFEH